MNRASQIAARLLEADEPADPKDFIMSVRDRRGPGEVHLGDNWVVNEVRSATGELGIPTGGTRRCRMEGCGGIRFGVRWPDGKVTWLCTRGLEFDGTVAKIPA